MNKSQFKFKNERRNIISLIKSVKPTLKACFSMRKYKIKMKMGSKVNPKALQRNKNRKKKKTNSNDYNKLLGKDKAENES